MKKPTETKYYVTLLVRDNDGCEDEYPTIGEFKTRKTAVAFARQTCGTVEVCGAVYDTETKHWVDSDEHIGFLNGEQQYHDERELK